ncbi:MAG: MmgE/PrpD family protein [Rhodospirillales bacterium]|nr:MmgE/PrpD family protein [Rhodospirillales bacterium]
MLATTITCATPSAVTARLAERLHALQWDALSPQATTVAKQCLLDWIGVSLAARNEPLVQILASEFAEEGESPIIGSPRRARLADAVLINGAMSHALDFDDVILGMGHPTVPVAPVTLGLAQALGADGRAALLAFISGVDVECRVGRLMGPSHYGKGWHGTGTFGTFGAMAAAAKLWSLDSAQLLHAFGLAGTQAAGLKSVFGTMCKPFHAGKAAQNGLLAARLARRGYTSDPGVLESVQGFAATQSTTVDPAAALADHPLGFFVVDALFKYHAACYLTHETIDATNQLRADHAVSPDQVEAIHLHVRPTHLGVCNIEEPRSGLECKFSLRMAAALAVAGEDTFQERLFSDATATRADLVALRRRVTVTPDVVGAGSTVEIHLKGGGVLSASADVSKPVRDLAAQQARVEAKFLLLAEPVVGISRAETILSFCRDLESASKVGELLELSIVA